MTPDPEEAKQYWDGIGGKETTYKKNAERLQNLREEFEQDNISITVDTVKQFLKQVPNWKAPGPDLEQGFWIKNFTFLHTDDQTGCRKAAQGTNDHLLIDKMILKESKQGGRILP